MSFKLINKATETGSNLALSSQDDTITPINESSDTASTIRELNDDTIKDNFSNIDMKTRLAGIEISSIISLDSLVALKFLPQEAGIITRSKKRLAVSLNGLGRKEIVDIAQGMNEQNKSKSMMDRLGGFFGVGK